MSNDTALITGANTGIGRITALTLARRGYQLILAGRSEQRTQAVIDEILQLGVGKRPHYVPLALDDLDSVRACVKQVIALDLPLRLLVNNAGVALDFLGHFAVGGGPELDHGIDGAGCQLQAVGRKGDGIGRRWMRRKRFNLLGIRPTPQLDGAVETGRGEDLAIGAEGKAVHRGGVGLPGGWLGHGHGNTGDQKG